ncbi:proton-conducting transporter transmembrane domain-containing protein, partial [Streptomyces sp. 900116325]
LRTLMPITFATFGLGYLAIIGIPPFSGFFSKDKIIEAAFGSGGIGGTALGTVALIGAGLTAFYMTRVMLMTFFGERRWNPGAHPHESPGVMTVPMIVLAVGSVAAGGLLAVGGTLEHWLEPVWTEFGGATEHGELAVPVWVVTAVTLAVVLIGAGIAYRQYGTRPVPVVAPAQVSAVTVAARRDLYGDDVDEAVFMRPGQRLVRGLTVVEDKGIDGATGGVGAVLGLLSVALRRLQTGFVRSYALYMFVGAAFVVAAALVGRVS